MARAVGRRTCSGGINGYDVATGKPVDGFLELKADGSTACGCWIYSGVYADGVNQAARRKPHWEQGPYDSEWGWTWPANRRVLYNRCSADPEGRPWSERKKLVWWDADKGEWTGHDVPDFPKTTAPGHVRRRGRPGPRACAAATRSSCRPTARRGCSRRTACWTGRCPRTTRPTSRRCATRSTASRATRRSRSTGGRTTRRTRTRRARSHRRVPVRAHHRAAHRAPHGRAG